MDIQDRKVLITGGSIGIGHHLALALVDKGAKVLVCARDEARLKELEGSVNGLYVAKCDVQDNDSVLALRDHAEAVFGTPDILINNAAIFRRLNLLQGDLTVDDWLAEVDTNLSGVLRVTHTFLRRMRSLPEASIVNLTSPSAYIPLAAAPVYSATKAAMRSWTLSLRHQLRNTRVNVIEVNPPAVDTRMNEDNPDVADLKLWSIDDFVREVMAQLQKPRRDEINVGDAKLVKVMSRVAPGVVFGKMNPTKA